jgi:hypothetical protein
MSGIIWQEAKESRKVRTNPAGLDMSYVLGGVIDDVAAWSYALGNTSPMRIAAGQVLYRQDVQLDHRGNGLWAVSVPYGPENKQVGQWDFDFDTQGGTVRIFQAKATQVFPAGGPDNKDAIDVQGNDVRGTEIVIPALRMNYTFRHPAGIITEAYARNIARNTGKTNNGIWHGFAAGECLFLGASGRSGSNSEATISYSIACSENVTGLTIGAIAGVAKKGWESVWISYKDVVDAGKPVKQPEYVYSQRVYDECSFPAVLGF